jgi:hypothetical protein
MRAFRRLGSIALIILTVTSLAGCRTHTAGKSSGGTTIGSRQIKFSVDGDGGIMPQVDGATVTFSEGKVVVEKARVLFNDKEVAKLSEGAKLVEVEYSGGALTIRVDGAKVHEAKLGK